MSRDRGECNQGSRGVTKDQRSFGFARDDPRGQAEAREGSFQRISDGDYDSKSTRQFIRYIRAGISGAEGKK